MKMMAHLFGRNSPGRRVQVKIPGVNGLLRSLKDEALVAMFAKACMQIKQTDVSRPHELVVEGIVDAFARCNGCVRELERRKKLHLLDGIENVAE